MQRGFPGAEIRLLRQLAPGAQPVEHAGIIGMGVEEGGVEVPKPAIGIVVEGEPALAVEHGDAGRELVERAAMRFRHPHQRSAQRIGLARVDRDADAAAADIDGTHVIDAPLATGHDRQPGIVGFGRRERAFHLDTVAGIEQLDAALDCVGRTAGLGRLHIGGVGIAQLALGTLDPDREGRGVGEAAQHLGFLHHRLQAEIGLRQVPAQSGQFANPDNGLTADRAARRLDGMAVRRGEVEQKALAALAQPVDRVVHLQRRFRRQPGSKGEDALWRILLHQKGRIAGNPRAVVAGRPGDQDLRLGEQQRAVAVGLQLQALDHRMQPGFALRGADAGVHQQDRRQHGKAEQRQRCGQDRDFLAVEVEQGREGIQEGGVGGPGGRGEGQRAGGERDQAVAHQ